MQHKKRKKRSKNRQVDIEFTDKLLTSFGGTSTLISSFLHKINFKEFIENLFPVQETSNNGSGSYSKVIILFITILNGGFRFSHMNHFSDNFEVIKRCFKIDKISKSVSSLTRFWNKFNKRSLNEKLLNVGIKFSIKLAKELKIKSDTLRFDSTVITRFGEQDGA